MRIKAKKTNKKPAIFLLVLLAILSLIGVLIFEQQTSGSKSSKADLEVKTEITALKTNYKDLILEKKNQVYSDSIFSVYTVQKFDLSTLVFVYEKLEGRAKDDHFFVHVHPKDKAKIINGKYINLDFIPTEVEPLYIDGVEQYIFEKTLASTNYSGGNIRFDEIDFVSVGRYKPGLGRLHSALGLKVDESENLRLTNGLETIDLYVKKGKFKKIKEKRKEAIASGILTTTENDLIKADIALNGESNLGGELRLKGDLPDHLKHANKWSYRFIMEDEKTFKGLRKFSIQHPKVRNYLWEWLFHKVVRDEQIIALRYDFMNVTLNVEGNKSTDIVDMGIMAVEESFDKILIEHNRQREGLILAFDESLLWEDRKKQMSTGLAPSTRSGILHSLNAATIRVFNQNKVLSNPKLAKQFEVARSLLQGLKEKKYKISEVFDLEKLTTFVALSNVFGGHHGLIWHNLRIYYNPVTNKLEPISFDVNGGKRIAKIENYPMSLGDESYDKMLLSKLKWVSSNEFINRITEKYNEEIKNLHAILRTEFDWNFDLSTLEYNSNFIKKQINPSDIITASLVHFNQEEIVLEVNNLTKYPVELMQLVNKKGRPLSTNEAPLMIDGLKSDTFKFKLNEFFDNAFVSKKNKKGGFRFPKDVKKIRLTYGVSGLGFSREADIIPYSRSQNLEEEIAAHQAMFMPNYSEFGFVSENTQNQEILFKSGQYELKKTLIIPSGYTVKVEEGFELDFKNGTSLISYSPIHAIGTKENPIYFQSKDASGAGIFISKAEEWSSLEYCIFSNLSQPKVGAWELSGAVNFHESDVTIKNSRFEKNRCEDGLNIIRSNFSIASSSFKDTYSDAFDGDFVKGEIKNSEFINSGNDGIDVSGSDLVLSGITVIDPSDKAISAGESSKITGNQIKIFGGEIGVVSKDLSKIKITDLEIKNTRLGLSSFQKKSEYGVGVIQVFDLSLVNNEQDYLIEKGSLLTIDDFPVKTVSNKVIDQMYGNEYGKSSR